MSQRVVELERDRGRYRKGDMERESKRKSENLRTNKKNTLKLL